MASKKRTSPAARHKNAPEPSKQKSARRGFHIGERLKEEISGLLLIALAVCLILSIASYHSAEQPDDIWRLHEAGQLKNALGIIGAYVSYFFINYTFGYAAIALPVLILAYGWLLLTHRSPGSINAFTIYLLSLMILVSVWFAVPSTLSEKEEWSLSGMIGGILALQLKQLTGNAGLLAIWITLSLLWIVLVTRISLADLIPVFHHYARNAFNFIVEKIENYRQQRLKNLKPQKNTEDILMPETSGEVADKPLIPEYLQPHVKESVSRESAKKESVNKEKPQVEIQKEIRPPQPERVDDQAPLTEQTSMTAVNPYYDTALIEDLKALEQITASIQLPDIDFDQFRKKEISEDKKPESVINSEQEKPDPVLIPRIANEDVAAGEFDLKKIEMHAADLGDLAEMAFKEELAGIGIEPDSQKQIPVNGQSNIRPINIELSKDTGDINSADREADSLSSMSFADASEDTEQKNKSENKTPHQPSAMKGSAQEQEEPDYDRANQAARSKYRFPSVDLLDQTHEAEKLTERDIAELDEKIHLIIKTLSQFGIDTKVVATEYGGPVVAIYQLELPAGLKISRITGLEDELALSMKVKSVRIVPMTAKGTIQVEIPKPKPSPVLIRSLFEDAAFKKVKQQFKLGLALGKDIDGKVHFEDLARMPHLLIAGTTGSGKSVGINSVLTSLLYQFDPSEVKLVLIDPKKVELALYRKLRQHHLICLRNAKGDVIEEVITKPENAKLILKALVDEMERRYDLLAHANVRNIEDYNKRWQEGRLPANGEFRYHKLEYIIVVVDELADLMMTAPKEVENSITRLAQMARAVGIHLIVATQRPSVDVLTGLIKANFPARIAYQVRSKIDSRTILDMSGAELLLGKGDMLYLPPGQMPIRIQNAFTSTHETEQIVDYISRMPPFPRKDFVIREEARENDEEMGSTGEYDSLYNEALEIVVKYNQGSASLLQRRLSIGYARAARIIDQLERNGVVSAPDGAKARQVLISEAEISLYKI